MRSAIPRRILILLLAASSGLAGNGERNAPLVETVHHNGVTLTLTVTPGNIALDRDLVLSLRIRHPADVTVRIPPVSDRLQGLLASSSFDRRYDPDPDGRIGTERIIRLTPRVESEYRIAPMAIACRPAQGPEVFFSTPPIVLERLPVSDAPPETDLRGGLRPLHIRPSLKTLSGWAGILVALAVLLALAVHGMGRLRQRIRLIRMSPRERALHELAQLLASGLLEAGRIKDFYVALTLIVRRYIERRHRIRAPEQTTPEFLQAIAADPRFPEASVRKLKAFLEAADLVKFAAYTPERSATDQAVGTARDYVTGEPPDMNHTEFRTDPSLEP